MKLFVKEALESLKYAEVVKLAKVHDVYRRYATKAELVDKLRAIEETPAETLNDVSMPSFMENEDTESDSANPDVENASPDDTTELTKPESRKGKHLDSHRSPLSLKGENIQSDDSKPMALSFSSRRSTPQPLRRSLAGPARKSYKLRQEKKNKSHVSSQVASPRMSRQETFDVVDNDRECDASLSTRRETGTEMHSRRLRREGTYELDEPETESDTDLTKNTRTRKLRRVGTFDVEGKAATKVAPSPNTSRVQLKREGTFEVDKLNMDAPVNLQTSKLKREGTFDLKKASIPRNSPNIRSKVQPIKKLTRSSVTNEQRRISLRSPCVQQKNSLATPSSAKLNQRALNDKSVPRRFITSRQKPMDASPAVRTSATKSKIPSLVNEIQRKKAEVSAKKHAEATGEKPVLGKKAPDFRAIHQRLFGKMESLVDSRQKVLDKANSMQKIQAIKRSPPNTKVVRKLLSPKVGKSKILSPKPTLQPTTSVFASHVRAIQRKPSVGSTIPGVSRLQSPTVGHEFVFKATNGSTNQFGFTKSQPSRKETLKAAVMGRKPLKRNSPMSKAKHALQSVRLNKRFELQMKHRLAQLTD